MANKTYIQSYYDGSLFEYSKDQKENFVEHKNSKGKVSYRKYYNKGVEGDLLWINRKNNEYLNNREEIEVVLRDGEDTYYITFPVLNGDGTQIDDFTEQIIRVLPSLEKGTRYNLNNWRMNKGDVVNGEPVKYTNMGVTFKQDGEKVEPTISYQTENNPKGDIPKLEWKEIAGKNRPSAASKEAKLTFLYDKLIEETDRLAYESNTQTVSKPQTKTQNAKVPTATPQEAFETTTDFNDDEYSDLPF